jgi:hypothetical protein
MSSFFNIQKIEYRCGRVVAETVLERKYRKYFFSGTAGVFPAEVTHNILWNRTVNLHGGANCNIPMDLENEYQNHSFKGGCFHAC